MPGSSSGALKVTAEHIVVPKAGERVSGDAAVFRRAGDIALFAVIDGLGHGPRAAEAADSGVAYLREAPLDAGVATLMHGLHRALAQSRGAAAMVCVWQRGRLQGCGVGNVELATIRTRVPVVLTPGIVGGHVRVLRPFEGPAPPGSRFVLYSDGISSRFSNEEIGLLPRVEACRHLMEKHRKAHDDATVMVVDVEG
ncbi:MAG TPA: PP2C family serine/threonine-protein phosphatase [Polyangiaceae bacterium]|jgi:negative regulator of sigma-B (phosphoserine phosphatase)